MATHSPLQNALKILRLALAPDRVSCADADCFAVSQDLWPRNILRMYHGQAPTQPAAVVWPQDVAEIQQVLAWANAHSVSVVAYGAGSGVVGGTTVAAHQVVIDLKRMQRVCEIDIPGRTCTAESGIMGELLERQLQRAGMSQGHFPSSIYCSTLGGWLATRSAGQASCRYGKIEDQVLGGVVVLGDGRVAKQIARPGLSPLFAGLMGNEGVLGIWAQATLRIHPLPEAKAFLAFDFPDLERALLAARCMLLEGLTPSILRIYDPLDTLLHRDTHGPRRRRDRGPSWSAALGAFLPNVVSYVGDRLSQQCRCIIITEGAQAVVNHDAQRIADIAQTYAGRAQGQAPARAWYNKRYAVSYRMSNVFRAGVAVDTMEVAAPWECLIPVYAAVKRAGLACGAQVMAHFSHMYLEGGSIYFTYAMPAAGGEAAYDRLWEATLNAAIDHGANVSHHHGVGQLKSAALRRAWGDYGAALSSLRRACDPNQILNPATLAMHSLAKAGVAAASPEAGPHARWMVARPEDTIGDLEALLARHGQTLGWTAALFPEACVLESTRRGRLWRINPQLGVIEPLVMGVDANLERTTHTFAAAPRAAQGPDLLATLLENSVTRIWVRTQKVAIHTWHAYMPRAAALANAQHLVQHPLAERLQCTMRWRGDGTVELFLTSDHEHPAHAELVRQLLPDASLHLGPWPHLEPCPDNAVRLAATWIEARTHWSAQFEAESEAFMWVDPAGMLGFIDARTQARMLQNGRCDHFFDDGITHNAPVATQVPHVQKPGNDTPVSDPAPPPQKEVAAESFAKPSAIACQAHRAALENCTFCPKLCRFACPVATATGNEANIPRQMMLATRLSAKRQRALTPSVAATLYTCVDCRGCRTFCDHDNDVSTTLQQARASLWGTDLVPLAVRRVCETLAARGAMPDSDASACVASLPRSDGERTALFLGCQNEIASIPAAQGALALTQASHGDTRLIDGGAQCCGHPLLRWGHKEAFMAHASRFAASLPRQLQLLVVDDPGCAYTLGTLYAEVAHVAMPEVTWAAKLLPAHAVAPVAGEHALHDSCFATRWLDQATLRETYVPKSRVLPSVVEGESGCCGGMLLPFYDLEMADNVSRQRVADIVGNSARRIVSPSPTCSRRLRQVQAPVDDLFALWHRSCDVPPGEGANIV